MLMMDLSEVTEQTGCLPPCHYTAYSLPETCTRHNYTRDHHRHNTALSLIPGRKKITKFDSLKPLLTLLESTLVTHGLDQRAADMVVLDIAERLVTAGYGWDKVLQYQAKVSSWGHLDSAV